MLKRIFCIILCTVISIIILPVSSYAKSEDTTYTDEQKKLIYINFVETGREAERLFSNPTALGYWNMVKKTEENSLASQLINVSSWVIDELPQEEDYAEILANLIMMQEGDLSEALEIQKIIVSRKK